MSVHSSTKFEKLGVVYMYLVMNSLIDWISDTLSQGYTNLQSLDLDHRGVASDTVCSWS